MAYRDPTNPDPFTAPDTQAPPAQGNPQDWYNVPDEQKRRQINDAYTKYLGRGATNSDYTSWIGNPNYDAGIAGSPEAQRFASTGTAQADYGATPAGWDQGKWNDPNKQDPKYTFGRIFQSTKNVGQAAAAIGAQVDPQDNRYITLGGQRIKVSNHAGTMEWYPQDGPGGVGTGGPEVGAGGADLSPYSGAGGVAGNSQVQDPAIHDAIMRLLSRGEAPVNASDPNIAAPTNAFRAQKERALGEARNALAERDAASGLNNGGAGSGSMDSNIADLYNRSGTDVGAFSANLVTSELQQRRQDVQNALQFATGEEKTALQALALQLDTQLRDKQLGQQNNQFYDNLSVGIGNNEASLNNILLRLTMGGA